MNAVCNCHSTMMKHLEPLQDTTIIILLKMFLLVQVLCTSAVIGTIPEAVRGQRAV